MDTVFDDILEVGSEGTFDLLQFDTDKSLMENIQEHMDDIDQQLLSEQTKDVVEEVSEFDPGAMWGPLIISAMIILAVLVLSCCSVCVFCWYIRYAKNSKEKARKKELEAKDKKSVKMRPRREYDQYDEDTELYYPDRRRNRSRPNSNRGSKHITMNNFNEETYKIINHLHRTMSEQRERNYNTLRKPRDCDTLKENDFGSSSSVHSIRIPQAGARLPMEKQKEAALYPALDDSIPDQHQLHHHRTQNV